MLYIKPLTFVMIQCMSILYSHTVSPILTKPRGPGGFMATLFDCYQPNLQCKLMPPLTPTTLRHEIFGNLIYYQRMVGKLHCMYHTHGLKCFSQKLSEITKEGLT